MTATPTASCPACTFVDSDFLSTMLDDSSDFSSFLTNFTSLLQTLSTEVDPSSLSPDASTTQSSSYTYLDSTTGVTLTLDVAASADPEYMLGTVTVTPDGADFSMVANIALTSSSTLASTASFVLKTLSSALTGASDAAADTVEAGGEAIADAAADAAAEGAAEAAALAGVELLSAASGVLAAVGIVAALSLLVIDLLRRPFNLSIGIINRSSVNFAMMPGQYSDGGDLTLKSSDTVLVDLNGQSTSLLLLPKAQCFPLGDGSGTLAPYKQAPYVSLYYNNDNDELEGIGTLLQLQQLSSYDPDSGTGTLDTNNDASAFLSVNFPYEIKKHTAVVHSFRNPDGKSMNDLYDQYEWYEYENAPVSGGASTADTSISWRVDTLQPVEDSGTWTIQLVMVIEDAAATSATCSSVGLDSA